MIIVDAYYFFFDETSIFYYFHCKGRELYSLTNNMYIMEHFCCLILYNLLDTFRVLVCTIVQ